MKGVALSTVVYSVASALVGFVFVAQASFDKSTNDTLATHTNEISQLKDSACVQNSNIRNIAAAVHASFVPDPHCPN